MKFLKAVGAFGIYFIGFNILIGLILPKSILNNTAIATVLILAIFVLSVYIAIKAYKLNTLSLFKIFNINQKNKQSFNVKRNSSKQNTDSHKNIFSNSELKSNSQIQNIENDADIEIVYEKSSGETSLRQIKVYRVDDYYLYGYCYLRNEDRTFKLDRIKKLKSFLTDEVMNNSKEIINYLQALYYDYDNDLTNENTTSKHIDDGYFNSKVDKNLIIDLKKDFHIVYKGNIKENLYIIRFGKLKYKNGYFLLGVNTDTDEFSGLYADKIIEMHDLETGEVIYDVNCYLEEIYNKEMKKYREKEEKQKQKEKIDNFIDEHLNLLKMLVYIAKSDGTINSKEKDILIETLEEHFPDIIEPNKIIDRIAKNHLYFKSYNAFARNAKQIIENYPEIDFLKFAEKIVSTQKNVHSDEEKILNYLSKIYNRDYKLNYQPEIRGQKVFNNEPCPHCNSTHTIKKGKRKYKNYTAQRYECQDCGKIFSVKEENNEQHST